MDGIFIAVCAAAGLYLAVAVRLFVKYLRSGGREAVQRRLAAMAGETGETGENDRPDIVRHHSLSSMPWLDGLLARWSWSKGLDRMLSQADIRTPVGALLLLAVVLALGGSWLASALWGGPIAALAGFLLPGAAPFAWIAVKRNMRLTAFENQLPDALDLVCRALKAGHTFASGMSLVASEFGEPLRGEFTKTLDEINFGMNVREALVGLAGRMDSPDLDFFVISVNIQYETGGNLAEIIENISTLIRERFKLRGKVSSLSAEGRLAAVILIALPICVGSFIKLTNPGYLQGLVDEPMGRVMLYTAVGQMLLGIVVIKKMISIKV